MQSVEISSGQEVCRAFVDVLSYLKNNSGVTKCLLENSSLVTDLQFFSRRESFSGVKRVVYELVVSHAFKAEQLGVGGFSLFVEAMTDQDKFADEAEKSFIDVRYPTHDDVVSVVKNCVGDTVLSKVVMKAVDTVGFNGVVSVEASQNETVSVEIVDGNSFCLSPSFKVTGEFLDARMFLVDGFIENVSEMNRILESAHELKDVVFVFARGFSPDVVNTLKVNFERCTACVVPFSIPLDFGSVNKIVDIATVVGADVVASTKGELVGSVDPASLPRVQRVVVQRENVIFKSRGNLDRSRSRIESIEKKRRSCEVSVLNDEFDSRMRSLMSKYVTIRLPEKFDIVETRQKIDRVLRTIKCYLSHGIVNIRGKDMSLVSVYHALVLSRECRKMINDVGSVIEVTE